MRPTSNGLVLGPLLLRAIAYLLDGALLAVFALIAESAGIVKLDTRYFPADAPSLAIVLGGQAIYNLGFLIGISSTPGKMAVNLFVGYPDGTRLRPDTAILRYLIVVAENLVIVGMLINIVLVAFDPNRRAIHDRVAGTLVLAGRPGAPLRVEDQQQRDESRQQ